MDYIVTKLIRTITKILSKRQMPAKFGRQMCSIDSQTCSTVKRGTSCKRLAALRLTRSPGISEDRKQQKQPRHVGTAWRTASWSFALTKNRPLV